MGHFITFVFIVSNRLFFKVKFMDKLEYKTILFSLVLITTSIIKSLVKYFLHGKNLVETTFLI